MNNEKFQGILTILIPSVVNLIAKKLLLSDIEATKLFYNSNVCAELHIEYTKVWQYSPLTIFNMFLLEQETGKVIYPD